ncbi:hypothetical protein [Luteolibacter luteus]|uniref:Uncharacterized protein n=1 Tax=Luteolibacter luteus TaxID=2728835 RepID=A0A858RKM0_9BACT|nr:hypothetical protein [Luteolibacter luteus]QJE97008.1 hypothetical protein HHL09_14845 [Luteolibacter luteus]
MPTAPDRFIAAATRPFSDDPELEIAARHELEGFIANAGEPRGDSLDQAALSLEKARPTGKWVRLSLYLLTAIVSLLVWGDFARSAYIFRAGISMLTGVGAGLISPEAWEKHLVAGKTPQERLILLGDTTKHSHSERVKALWDSDPENPAYFADYATIHSSERTVLPPDFLATARRLDPGNAWFLSIAAGVVAKDALDTTGYPTTTPGGAKLRPIKDPAKLDEAMSLLHEAAQATRIESYSTDLLRQRIKLLPPRTDVINQVIPIYYVAGTSTLSLRLRTLGDAVAARANQLAKSGDADSFRQLTADWDKFSRTLASARYANLVDMMITLVTVRIPLKSMIESAKELGLTAEEERLQKLEDRFDAWKTVASGKPYDNKPLELHGSVLASTSLAPLSKQTRETIPITETELKPGRLADHAFAGRLLDLLGWLALALTLLAAFLYRFRASKLVRGLSLRLQALLQPLDWAWIMGVGIIAPFASAQLIQRFTPLGGSEWSLRDKGLIVTSGQAVSTLLMMIFLPLLIARWRLSLRAGAAGLSCRTRLWTSACAIFGALALLLFGAIALSEPLNRTLTGAACLILVALALTTSTIGIRAIFGQQGQLLRRVTLSRILMPAYATGMLLMMGLFLIHHAEEKHWIARDQFTGINPDKPGLSGYEHEVTQQMRREVIEILNSQP